MDLISSGFFLKLVDAHKYFDISLPKVMSKQVILL